MSWYGCDILIIAYLGSRSGVVGHWDLQPPTLLSVGLHESCDVSAKKKEKQATFLQCIWDEAAHVKDSHELMWSTCFAHRYVTECIWDILVYSYGNIHLFDVTLLNVVFSGDIILFTDIL
jgi:hypothetical protein